MKKHAQKVLKNAVNLREKRVNIKTGGKARHG